MRVFGVEGGGNAIAGCYPDSDMLIDFGHLPVEWGPMQVVEMKTCIALKWSTYQETNSDLFVIQRETESGDYENIGSLAAAGTSATLTKYEFMDANPVNGVNHYRILQVDHDGSSKSSRVLEGNFNSPVEFGNFEIGPIPCLGTLNVSFFHPNEGEEVRASLIDVKGAVQFVQQFSSTQGANSFKMDLEQLPQGINFLQLDSKGKRLTKKLIKA